MRRYVRVGLLLALVLALAVLGSGRTSASAWTTPAALNSNAGTDTGSDLGPQVTTDGLGNWVAAWASDENLGGIGTDWDILVSRSTNNGATWAAPAPLNINATTDSGNDMGPQVTTDGEGNWVAVWQSDDTLGGTIGPDLDILVSRSTNNGATWTAPAALNTNAGTDSGGDWGPQVTTDGAGNWVAAWTSNENLGGIGTDGDILVSRSTDNGATWTAPAALNTNAATDSGLDGDVQVTTDKAGNWVAAWESNDTLGGTIGSDWDILVARSTNNGATWTAPAALNTNAGTDSGTDRNHQVTTDGAGQWVTIWESNEDLGGIGTDYDIFVSRSTNNGATWTAPAVLNTNAATDSGDDCSPQVTTDGPGNWVTVWYSNDSLGGTIGGDWDILVSRSADNGVTWTAPTALNTNAATGDEDDQVPQVTADGLGNWLAVWQSTDSLGGTIGTDYDILYATEYTPPSAGTLLLALNTPNPQAVALFGASVAVGDTDGDGKINDGCPALGFAETAGVQCNNALDDDADAFVNDGCPTVGTPETGAQCNNALDDDSDGKADIAVGARWEDVGGNDDQGRAYVFSGAGGSRLFTLDMPPANAEPGAWFGYSVAMGDVDGDGKADIVVGAPYEEVGGNDNQGRAYVFSGLNGSLLYTLDMPPANAQADANFGYAMVVLDDASVPSDGKREIAVGAPYEDVLGYANEGRVYVFSGADGSLFLTLGKPGSHQADANFGFSVAAGDVTGDGKRDGVAGAPGEAPAQGGAAYVFNGVTGALITTLLKPNPADAGAQFGYSVAMGVVNGDSAADIAVGAPHEHVAGGYADQGKAYVFSGADGSLLFPLTTPNPQANAYFGEWLALGDVNADGKADIAAGADAEDVDGNADQGRAYVFSGADRWLLTTLDTPSPQPEVYFGHGLAMGYVRGCGLINDGCPELGGPPESGVQCNNAVDDDADGVINDGCPAVGPPESGIQCNNALDDDADAKINDGCPAAGGAETGSQCNNALDDDSDGLINDGCPAVGPPESGAQCDNALDDDGDAGADIVVGAGGQDVSGNDKQGRAYVFSAGGLTSGGTRYYDVEFRADHIWLDGDDMGDFFGTGRATVIRGDPYWEGGKQCADYHVQSLTLTGYLGTLLVEIKVGEGLTVPVSSGVICEDSPNFDVTLHLYVEEWDEGGGFTFAADEPNMCSCWDGVRWSSIDCTAVVSEDPPNQIAYDCGTSYRLCYCGTGDDRVLVGAPQTGALLLSAVGGVAEWPGATADSDQSTRPSAGSDFKYIALGAALAAVAVIVLGAGAWLATRRWAR